MTEDELHRRVAELELENRLLRARYEGRNQDANARAAERARIALQLEALGLRLTPGGEVQCAA